MKCHYEDDYAGAEAIAANWRGMRITVAHAALPRLHLQSAQGGLMRLNFGEKSLFWAEIDDSYSGVSLYRPLVSSQGLLPAITSQQLPSGLDLHEKRHYWARYFVRALSYSPNTCFYDGLWSLHSMAALQRKDQAGRDYPRWCGRVRADAWQQAVVGEDFAFLQAPCVYIDWGACGNGGVINLFGPSPAPEQHGRIKWWRKVLASEQLPPILLWYLNSLDAYVILDGHDRLQACILEKCAPDYLVLSSFTEQSYPCDPVRQQAIQQQLNLLESRMAQGIAINPSAWNGAQQALVVAFDDRPHQRKVTRSRAKLSEKIWHEEVSAFMRTAGNPDWYVLPD